MFFKNVLFLISISIIYLGLIPPRIINLDIQEARAVKYLRQLPTELDKYVYLMKIHDENETLFYHIAMKYLGEIMPLIYTPTVGSACQNFSYIPQRPNGLYISINDKNHIGEVLSLFSIL